MQWIENLRNSLQRKKGTPSTSRQYVKRTVAVLIFSAIVLVFVMFGYSGRQTQSGQLARVGNRYITIQEYRVEVERLQRMYAGMFGNQMNADTQRQFFQRQALESLVSQEVLSQGASHAGILVSDDEIRDLIFHDIPAFQDEGKFDKERYFSTLEANHFTASEFETKVRQERIAENVRNLFENSFVKMDLALEKQKDLEQSVRHFAWVSLDEAAAKKKSGKNETEWPKIWLDTIQKLDGAAKKSDTAAIEATLRENGFTWTNEDANLSQEFLTKLGSTAASKRAFELGAAGQYSGVINDGGRKYLVQLKSISTSEEGHSDKKAAAVATASPSTDADNKVERWNEAFSMWLENEKAATKIEQNEALLSSLR